MEIKGKIKAVCGFIYDDLRAIMGLDLNRNEIKVLITYRIEMDEATRQVRGKSQDVLRAKCGLSEQQFSSASGSLQRRGLIQVQRHRNAPQTVIIGALPMHEQPLNPVAPEIRSSVNQEHGNSGNRNPETPETGTPENPVDDIYTAPVSAQESSQANAGGMPAHVKPITSWSTAFAVKPEPEHASVGWTEAGALQLFNGTRQLWLERFGNDAERLDLALIEIAGEIHPNSRKDLSADVQARLARKAADKLDRDQRYRAAVAANAAQRNQPKPVKLSRW